MHVKLIWQVDHNVSPAPSGIHIAKVKVAVGPYSLVTIRKEQGQTNCFLVRISDVNMPLSNFPASSTVHSFKQYLLIKNIKLPNEAHPEQEETLVLVASCAVSALSKPKKIVWAQGLQPLTVAVNEE